MWVFGLGIRPRCWVWILGLGYWVWVSGMGILGMVVLGLGVPVLGVLGMGRYVNWLRVWCECVVGVQIGCGRVSYVPVRPPFEPVRVCDLLYSP